MNNNTPLSEGKKDGGARYVFGLSSCYAVATFCDNFFKQVVVLMAATLAKPEIQSIATILFALPFIFCSAWCGWITDKFSKKDVIIATKVAELLILAGGYFALVYINWAGMLAVIFLVGLVTTALSPALTGSIPELFNNSLVPRVNSWVKLSTTCAVLAGIAGAGIFLDLRPGGALPSFGFDDQDLFGRAMAGAFGFLVSGIGATAIFFIGRREAAFANWEKKPKFPWSGPVDSVRYILECKRNDKQLYLVLFAEAVFYGVAAICAISIANLAKDLGYSDTLTSLLSASLMIGIAIGAVIVGRYKADSWKQILIPATTLMGICLLLTALAGLLPKSAHLIITWNPQLIWLFIILPLSGVCGGMYLIPLASFIQIRPDAGNVGKALGLSNFMTFAAIAIFGATFGVVGLLPPAATFIIYGLVTILFAFNIFSRQMRAIDDLAMADIPPTLPAFFVRMALKLRYKITVKGLENIESKGPSIFLPNHPALIDPFIVYSSISGLKPKALVDENQLKGWVQRLAVRVFGIISVPTPKEEGSFSSKRVRKSFESVVDSLKSGRNVLLYPSGRILRSSKEEIGAKSAVERILKEIPDVNIVLVRTSNLWGSSFSHANENQPKLVPGILRSILKLLANGLFFAPKRPVLVEFVQPENFPRAADKNAVNAWLEDFYNAKQHDPVNVPYYFWKK